MKIAFILAFALCALAHSVRAEGEDPPPEPAGGPAPEGGAPTGPKMCCLTLKCDDGGVADTDFKNCAAGDKSCITNFDAEAAFGFKDGACSTAAATEKGKCLATSPSCNCASMDKCNKWKDAPAAALFPEFGAPMASITTSTAKSAVGGGAGEMMKSTTPAADPGSGGDGAGFIRSNFLCVAYSLAAVGGFSLFTFARS